MKYLKKFQQQSEYAGYDAKNGEDYKYSTTAYIEEGEDVKYTDYERMPLTFQIIGEKNWQEGDTYEIFLFNNSSKKIKVRVNDGEWAEYPFSEGGEGETEKSTITGLTPGDLVQFESDVPQTYSFEDTGSFGCNTKFNIFGNLNSLNAYSNVLQESHYSYLFGDESNIVSAKNAISLDYQIQNFYQHLFQFLYKDDL